MNLGEKFEVHDTLNPKLWTNSCELIPEIRERIIEIVNQFISISDIPIHLVDIHLVGSQASYNYTQYSDLDVHIITNFDIIDASPEVTQILFNCLKSKFNNDYDITIKGIDVELYVEDIRSGVTSNGIYSIYENRWLKFPEPLTDIVPPNVDKEFSEWENKIRNTINSEDSNEIQKLIDNIYLVRKNSLITQGEYGSGNYLFKQIRDSGLLDRMKDTYKQYRSKELTLERYTLNEDSRSSLLAKSKQSQKGMQRFRRRVKSRVANSVKQYNSIDMNKLFKQNILTVDIEVKGETDTYQVKISFGGFLDILRDQLKRQNNEFNLKAVTKALIIGFNRDDVYIHCSCADWQYRFAYYATRNDLNSGEAENRPSDITNPDDKLGSGCKHVLLVLSNTSWILKVASTIYNYTNYMQKHYEKLYAKIIYPAIFGKKYEEPVQLDIFDDDTLDTDKDTIDSSNIEARTKNQFQKGNTQGVRFASKHDDRQQTLDIDNTEEET